MATEFTVGGGQYGGGVTDFNAPKLNTGGSMPLGGGLAAGIIGAVGTLGAAGIQAATAGGSEASGFTLEPEYELQLFDYFQKNQTALAADYKKIQAISDIYVKQLDTIKKTIAGTIPSTTALNAIRNLNVNLAKGLGMSALDLVANGFIDVKDADVLSKYEALTTADQVADPKLEGQIKDERAKLEQDLFRSGASPAIRAQALTQFDRQANESRFSRSQELKSTQAGLFQGYLGTSSGLRQQGFNQAVGTSGVLQGQIDSARTGAGALSQISGNQAAVKYQALEFGQGLRAEGMQNFQDLGKFLLSDESKRALSMGYAGPGSLTEQLGGEAARRVDDRNIFTDRNAKDAAGNPLPAQQLDYNRFPANGRTA